MNKPNTRPCTLALVMLLYSLPLQAETFSAGPKSKSVITTTTVSTASQPSFTNLKDLAQQFYQAFCAKDLKGLEALFAGNITISDWQTRTQGLVSSLDANQKIFEDFSFTPTIPLEVINLHQSQNTIFAEVEIVQNQKGDKLYVVDVIEFDEAGRITAIRAYKR